MASNAASALGVLWALDAAACNDADGLRHAFESRSASPAESDFCGRTALHAAAAAGAEASLQLLLSCGAPVDARNKKEGCTPLHLASGRGFAACVAMLLARAASVEISDRAGKTPLHDAAWGGHTRCVQELLAAGACVRARDSWGRTPLHWASCPPQWVGDEHADGTLAVLLDARAPLESPTQGGCTVLHWAAGHGRVPSVTRLLRSGAQPNALNARREAPLHRAAANNREAAAVLLLAWRADPAIRDQDGRSPLERAHARGHDELARRLHQRPVWQIAQ